MVLMNLREWDTLTVEQRKQWIKEQSPKSLTDLLVMIREVIDQTTAMEKELDTLDPVDTITIARTFTRDTLRDIQSALSDYRV